MSRLDFEQQAALSVLSPLADYVVNVGAEKTLSHYSKAEVIGLVDTILKAYHDTLKALYQTEVPF